MSGIFQNATGGVIPSKGGSSLTLRVKTLTLVARDPQSL
jgi:hypothetical protein